ncbi:hypothetical protein Hanom_Chr03g00238141 [Helianthus anomalus]
MHVKNKCYVGSTCDSLKFAYFVVGFQIIWNKPLGIVCYAVRVIRLISHLSLSYLKAF